jgi:hypothetical protein
VGLARVELPTRGLGSLEGRGSEHGWGMPSRAAQAGFTAGTNYGLSCADVSMWMSYADAVTTKSSTVSSPPLTFFALISSAGVALLLFLAWNHNHSMYQRQFAD